MANLLIGRKKEQVLLKEILNSPKAEFLALVGRRRVGKTYLVRNFFEKESCTFFYCSGLKDGSLKQHLAEFAIQIGQTFYGGAAIVPRNNWFEAFEDLNAAMTQSSSRKKIVLFIDEFPWLATKRSRLLQALDYYWNRYWSHENNLKLIVCGSSASWIINNIINNKGGLYNRVTRTMHLSPFTLHETKQFLSAIGLKLNHKHVVDFYMALGGIPYYLSLVRKGMSAYQSIDELCFQKNGALVKEFGRLFAALFENSDSYVSLIRVIAQYHYGIGQAQLIKESKAPDGGRTIKRLKELEEAGFIIEFIPYGHKEKGIYYKITDEFTLFYLRWMEPNLKTILKQDNGHGYWLAKTTTPHWKSWAGYAFESICYKHLTQIRHALAIDAGAQMGSWRYAPKQEGQEGAQIDLLFDRADNVITVCEIKYNEQPFIIDKHYAKILTNKLRVYQERSQTPKQLFLAMICAGGIKPSIYSEELVHGGIVTLDDLFA